MSNPTNPFWKHWKLTTDRGRQRWVYAGAADVDPRAMEQAFRVPMNNPNSGDRVYRHHAMEQDFRGVQAPDLSFPDSPISKMAFDGIQQGWDFYRKLQMEDGHWPGDYGGPMFLLPGLIIAAQVTKTPFPASHQALMRAYMLNHQNSDGGWGLHIEGDSTMFGTVMQYCALRILGLNAEERNLVKARQWIVENGGATGIPSWGKFFMALLGVFSWKACHSLFPEMWLLPKGLPVHPWRYWCHCRMVYLPMAYCYGAKVTAEETDLVVALREELLDQPFDSIKWRKVRADVALTDRFHKTSGWVSFLNFFTNTYEGVRIKSFRRKALRYVMRYVDAEDEQTRFVDIGPVNQIINSVCAWHAHGPDSKSFKQHVDRWPDYLWVAEDGMKMNGYNGSQLWDTAFALQALVESGFSTSFPDTVNQAYHYVDVSQIREEPPSRKEFFRHTSQGGWPFSTFDHGWPISDCTAEGLKAALAAHRSAALNPGQHRIDYRRMQDSIQVLLSFQNKDGGWGTYENQRAPAWLEKLNPSEVYGKIMVDYSWTECTSACLQALSLFHQEYPEYRSSEIGSALRRGQRFLRKQQRNDGSFEGAWGVCFTYGTWFGIEGLLASGGAGYQDVREVDEGIDRACAFLLSKQRNDGGWGESYLSCVTGAYSEHRTSQVVQTAWALLALMQAEHPDRAAIERGIGFLRSRQQENGDWDQEGISGVFNQNCMITYTAYRNVFPLWALGRYIQRSAEVGQSTAASAVPV